MATKKLDTISTWREKPAETPRTAKHNFNMSWNHSSLKSVLPAKFTTGANGPATRSMNATGRSAAKCK